MLHVLSIFLDKTKGYAKVEKEKEKIWTHEGPKY
jgi:hypothetical protein